MKSVGGLRLLFKCLDAFLAEKTDFIIASTKNVKASGNDDPSVMRFSQVSYP